MYIYSIYIYTQYSINAIYMYIYIQYVYRDIFSTILLSHKKNGILPLVATYIYTVEYIHTYIYHIHIYTHIVSSLFIPPLMDIWVASIPWLLKITLLWTMRYVHLSEFLFWVFFGYMYPEMELLSHMVLLFLAFWEISIPVFIVAAPIYIPTNSAGEFSFLYILDNTCYLWSFWMIAILTGVRWYFIVINLYFLND